MKLNVLAARFAAALAFALSLIVLPALASADNVAVVEIHPTSYGAVETFVVNTISAEGGTVTVYVLDGTTALPSLDAYSQVWVIDFSSNADNAPTQVASYATIGAWWIKKNRHIIADARLMGSEYDFGTVEFGYPADAGRPETQLIENYYENLSLRGGGLFLGTDHSVFSDGINTINADIGIGVFYGEIYAEPQMSEIDQTSSIMSYPAQAGHHANAGNLYIWSDSSPGDVAISEQPNGRILYPVAWFGGDSEEPTVSTTITGPPSYSVGITAPTTAATYMAYSDDPITFTGSASGGTAPYTYAWSSSVTGSFGTTSSVSFTKTSSAASQIITVTVTDSQGVQESASLTLWRGICTDVSQCPSGTFCTDGVCCATACAGGANDCQACSISAGGSANGTCTAFATGATCSDGDACTTGDSCDNSGDCTPTGPTNCDDANACTTDTCDMTTGCAHANVLDGTVCDDGSDCTSGDACSAGTCTGVGITCTAAPCQAPLCDPATGCSSAPMADGTACDDNNACTVNDTCASGACVPGSPLDCSATSECKTGSCDPTSGCAAASVADGTPCTGGSCAGGACVASESTSGTGGTGSTGTGSTGTGSTGTGSTGTGSTGSGSTGSGSTNAGSTGTGSGSGVTDTHASNSGKQKGCNGSGGSALAGLLSVALLSRIKKRRGMTG